MHFDVASPVPTPQLMLLKDTGNPVKSLGPTTCTSIWSIEFGGILDCKSEFAWGRLRENLGLQCMLKLTCNLETPLWVLTLSDSLMIHSSMSISITNDPQKRISSKGCEYLKKNYIFATFCNICFTETSGILMNLGYFWWIVLRLRGSFGGRQLALNSSAPWWDDMAEHGPSGTSRDPRGQLFLGHHINSHEPNAWLLAL